MKKILYSMILAAAAMPATAAINTVNYQALVRDANGKPVVETSVGIRFRVVGSEGNLYQETATVKTDAVGMVNYEIGSQNPEDFAGINWNATGGTKLEVAYDLKGGSDYTATITSNISSVPTALHALTSADSQELKEGISEINVKLSDQANMNENYQNAFNEIQTKLADQANMNENYQNAITELNTKLAEANGVIENLVLTIKDLTNRLEALENK